MFVFTRMTFQHTPLIVGSRPTILRLNTSTKNFLLFLDAKLESPQKEFYL
jgi:hypothetical protein